MTTRLRVGVAGAGVFGGYHASKYAAHPDVRLTAVFDIDGARASALASRFSSHAFSDFDIFLAACDAIVIAAPASVHYALACRALEAGKHLFIEKPVTLDVDEADALISLAREKELILQVGHQERYVFAAAGLLARGKAPLKIDSIRCTTASGRCEDVSVALDLMVHDIDLVRQLTGADIASIAAEGSQHALSAELKLTNGTLASLRSSRRTETPERRMTLIYDDGIIEFDFVKREVTNSTPAVLEADFSNDAAPLSFTDPLGFGANVFISCISLGREPIVTGEDGREALRWALEVEEAARLGIIEERAIPERQRA